VIHYFLLRKSLESLTAEQDKIEARKAEVQGKLEKMASNVKEA